MLALGCLVLTVCQLQAAPLLPQSCKLSPSQKSIQLPPATFQGLSVEQALQQRRSERSFAEEKISLEQLSQLLWAAQGITRRKSGQRTAPSSGRSYPIDLYVSMQRVTGVNCGLYHYQPDTHSLSLVKAADYAAALAIVAEGQRWVQQAAVVILHVATPARAAKKYGTETALPSALIETGHISQNIYLQATSMGLAVLGMNGFHQQDLDRLLDLQSAQTTLFINLVAVRPDNKP